MAQVVLSDRNNNFYDKTNDIIKHRKREFHEETWVVVEEQFIRNLKGRKDIAADLVSLSFENDKT